MSVTGGFSLPLETKWQVYTKKPKKNEPDKLNFRLNQACFQPLRGILLNFLRLQFIHTIKGQHPAGMAARFAWAAAAILSITTWPTC